MKGFNFEKNLAHQEIAIKSTVQVFAGADIENSKGMSKQNINPLLNRNGARRWFYNNVQAVQVENGIHESDSTPDGSNIVDIMMETGTGKTYTYTKTIFELNKHFGMFKFVVVVPTLSIKAGTINFLVSESSRQHFKEQYGKTIDLHVVESIKKKSKKSRIPPAVSDFVNAKSIDKNSIQVMVINRGMINSDTMLKHFDKTLLDEHSVPFDAISAIKPFMIIDEPHKFAKGDKTWQNIEKMNPQFILRYGATFPEKEFKRKIANSKKEEKYKVKDYHNLIYILSAVDSFNRNLVKGVIGHITEFEQGANTLVKLVNTDGKEANFELTQGKKKTTVKLEKKESLVKIHQAMRDLTVESLNKSVVLLSNGLELKKGDKINPFSYSQTLQEVMLEKAVKEHFKCEKELLTREVKIKPLTLFFIDNIEEYRGDEGYLKITLEKLITSEATKLLKENQPPFYQAYLQKTLDDISLTHGGYFSRDNSESDEKIEKEINEILHDKQALLDLDNTRRFIFSKWTLREGWDNPNVFQICKLRSSGSDISKLQEVGRGLRLPVNEYGNRVKDEQFYLNYFVDFTESDFINNLVSEINSRSGAVSLDNPPDKLDKVLIENICRAYGITEEQLLDKLDDNNAITRSNEFKDNGWQFVTKTYPLAFEGVNNSKIRTNKDKVKKITVRTDKYSELKELWEKLNEKVVLEYGFDSEQDFEALLVNFFDEYKDNFDKANIKERKERIEIKDGQAVSTKLSQSLQDKITPIVTMTYDDFLNQLANGLKINLKTIHQSFIGSKIDINPFLNPASIRYIVQNFKDYLLYNAIDKFTIDYKRVSNRIHPTKFTNKEGKLLNEINSANVGVLTSDETVADNYFFDELYYDSDLERKNIITEIKEVVVFTKIPKNSIKIPVAGGRSYSPDFAYVINLEDGTQQLNFIVETKGKDNNRKLTDEEKCRIKHAEKLFGNDVNITFKTQFSNDKILEMINNIL